MHHRHRRLTLYLNRDPIIDCELSGKAKIRHRNQNEKMRDQSSPGGARRGRGDFLHWGWIWHHKGSLRHQRVLQLSHSMLEKIDFYLKTHHSRQLGGGHRKVAAKLFLDFFLSILWSLFSSFYQHNNDLGQEYEQNEDHDPKMFMNIEHDLKPGLFCTIPN